MGDSLGWRQKFAALIPSTTRWLKRPMVAIHTALSWHALRPAGIADRIRGFGPLPEKQ